MFGPYNQPKEQILRLPHSSPPQPTLRMCTSQEIPREQYSYQRPQQPKQKISIKQILNKRNNNTHSSTSLSFVSNGPVQEDMRMPPNYQKNYPIIYSRTPSRAQNVQNNNAVNYIFGECVINPKIVRIIYHNSPIQKTKDFSTSNQHNFSNSPSHKITTNKPNHNPETTSITHQPAPIKPKEDENEVKKEKTQIFNEFMSFGPKNFEVFKKMETLNIDQITSQIVEETERTDPDKQNQHQNKRLAKTYSEVKLRNQRDRFGVGSQLTDPFTRSNLFRSIKRTETMGGRDENSDHESEVVEKFESLMQKVRENRLDNSIIDI